MRWWERILSFLLDLAGNLVKTAFVLGMLLFWLVCIAFVVELFR